MPCPNSNKSVISTKIVFWWFQKLSEEKVSRDTCRNTSLLRSKSSTNAFRPRIGTHHACVVTLTSGGSRISQTGAPTYYFAKFHRKLHENEENWTGGASKFLLCRSAPANTHFKETGRQSWLQWTWPEFVALTYSLLEGKKFIDTEKWST